MGPGSSGTLSTENRKGLEDRTWELQDADLGSSYEELLIRDLCQLEAAVLIAFLLPQTPMGRRHQQGGQGPLAACCRKAHMQGFPWLTKPASSYTRRQLRATFMCPLLFPQARQAEYPLL